jgi:hypothetical protein
VRARRISNYNIDYFDKVSQLPEWSFRLNALETKAFALTPRGSAPTHDPLIVDLQKKKDPQQIVKLSQSPVLKLPKRKILVCAFHLSVSRSI